MQAETTYNWDDIEVGRFDLNHSENFFSKYIIITLRMHFN